PSKSSPCSTRSEPGTSRPCSDPDVPVRRWQRVQWHHPAEMSGSAISNRTPPQRQPPVSGRSTTPARLHPDVKLGAADRGVEQLDGMGGGERAAGTMERRRDLEQAAGVGADVEVGLDREHLRRLAIAELAGGLRLDEVVDTRAAAGRALLVGLGRLEARD